MTLGIVINIYYTERRLRLGGKFHLILTDSELKHHFWIKQGTIWGSGDEMRLGCMLGKCQIHCPITQNPQNKIFNEKNYIFHNSLISGVNKKITINKSRFSFFFI